MQEVQEMQVRSLSQGRSPGKGNGNPLQHSCLQKFMDRGAWWATVHRVAKSRAHLKQLGTAHMYTYSWFMSLYSKTQRRNATIVQFKKKRMSCHSGHWTLTLCKAVASAQLHWPQWAGGWRDRELKAGAVPGPPVPTCLEPSGLASLRNHAAPGRPCCRLAPQGKLQPLEGACDKWRLNGLLSVCKWSRQFHSFAPDGCLKWMNLICAWSVSV